MKTTRRIRPWRWLVQGLQALILLGLPFVSIDHQSAFRFDVPSLTLHVFGVSVAMDEFFIILAALLFLTFLLITLTVLFGRIWCGWLCPQTVISELTGFIERTRGQGAAVRICKAAAVLVISVVLAADLLWYFVPPSEFLQHLSEGNLGTIVGWSWAVLSIVIFLNFMFLRRTFCATICPYAKMQSVLFDEKTLIIAADNDRMGECMHCDACVRECPVGIDIRNGLTATCIACAACIDACAGRMERRGLRSLIGYRFGSSAAVRWLTRRPALLAGAITVIFLVMIIVLAITRQSFEMDVLADASRPPYRTADHLLINTYVLTLTNRMTRPLSIRLKATAEGKTVAISPSRFVIDRAGHRRFLVTAVWKEETARIIKPVPVTFSAETEQVPRHHSEQGTLISVPWE